MIETTTTIAGQGRIVLRQAGDGFYITGLGIFLTLLLFLALTFVILAAGCIAQNKIK